MNLRDAKDQIERDHPELGGTAKIEAIKELRAQAAAAEAARKSDEKEETPPTPATVTEGWIALVAVVIGMRLLAWGIWGSINAGPTWYDVLYVVLFAGSVAGLIGAYRRR